ncbi:hypothetical protein F4553_002884 [Allocatelliglobosispora scoriae]|uniref:Uncharacterized protein n=1 Tax=Allocatelliglobosispora scoriae TaxID=643052 RepID=A0A841BPA7_9ACTN|nr:hypothetical protein [Allocatelliglobosispora scoriae]
MTWEALVGWLRRLFDNDRSPVRQTINADLAHLENFVRTRYGVEAFIEPKTTVTETTVILIAHDGEWTRRRVSDPGAAWQFGKRLNIPVYDVKLTGYPQRMRDYNERRRGR